MAASSRYLDVRLQALFAKIMVAPADQREKALKEVLALMQDKFERLRKRTAKHILVGKAALERERRLL